MMRLRVATVLTELHRDTGRLALNGVLALDQADYERTIILGVAGDTVLYGEDAVTDGPTGRAHTAGVRVIGVPWRGRAGRRRLATVLADGEYDIVHTYGAKAGGVARSAAARAGISRIVHTWDGLDEGRWLVGIAIERLAARHTDAFLAVGVETATRALRLGLTTPERVRVSWPAVDVSGVGVGAAARAKARRKLDVPLGARVVGCVGSRRAAKVFAKAIAALPADVYGIWIGTPPLPRRLGGLRVAAHGDEQADPLAGFDVLVVCDRSGGIPAALVRAVAAGIPLVGATLPGIPEIVRSGETGLLVVDRRPAQLAAAISYILQNPAEARRMVTTAREWLGDHCEPPVIATVLDEVYRGTSRRPSSPRGVGTAPICA
jgi:glycosyltransferase involved in cell wall biosynthesis